MLNTILQISNLNVSYGDKHIIEDFSLSLDFGEKIIISGSNGCGKTTLLKCILGNIKSDSGIIKKNTENIAYCKQDFPNTSFPISAREVVEMGLFKNSVKDKNSVINAMQATGTVHLADRAFYSLSGGERQRVSLARCFCQKADLLLFDEPSSFLDSASLISFADILNKLSDRISAIVVTHDSSLLEKLDWRNVSMSKEKKYE